MASEIVMLSVPLPTFVAVNVMVSATLGEAAAGLGVLAVTATPALNPTVTETEPVTGAYALPFASVYVAVAVFVITVPSGVWARASVATANNAIAMRVRRRVPCTCLSISSSFQGLRVIGRALVSRGREIRRMPALPAPARR